MLTSDQTRSILPCVNGEPSVTLIKRANDVYRIVCGADTFFLKTYTKDWYSGDVAGTDFCVDHEASSWRVMRENGLSVPDVVVAEMGCDNPLERPFLVTRALRGRSLTDLLREADATRFEELLQIIGAYMRAMHSIVFEYSGYISSAGLSAPPDPNAWQHTTWTPEQFEKDALHVWEGDRAEMSADLMTSVKKFYAEHVADLRAAYQPPRFTHGDCHAHQFFIDGDEVTGVIDMEVTSAGNPYGDLLKFCLEMAAAFPVQSRWWEGLFKGYGEPSFNQVRLWMVAAHHINFQVVNWPGTRAQIVQHVLNANDWYTLFNLSGLADRAG